MNPAVIDPDLAPVHPNPDALPQPTLNPPPDLTNDTVLLGLLVSDAEGMAAEARAADPRGDCSGGHANPMFFYNRVSQHITAAVKRIKQLTAVEPKPPVVPKEEAPPPVEPKPEAPKKKS